MTMRERVLAVIRGRPRDRVPFTQRVVQAIADFGATCEA